MNRGGPIPTLGWPTRTDAVLALRAQGKTSLEIAGMIGIPHKTVAALEHSAARRRAPRNDAVAGGAGRAVLFDPRVLARLGPNAASRGITTNELARRIVEAVACDNLVDAILDDGED